MICYAILNEDDNLETTVLASSEEEALLLATTQFDTESWYAVPWSTWIFGTVEQSIAPIRARLAKLNPNDLSVGQVGDAADDYLDGICGIYAPVGGVGQVQADCEGPDQPQPVFHAHAAHDVQVLLKAIDYLREHLEDEETP